jgi:hypothetical protein
MLTWPPVPALQSSPCGMRATESGMPARKTESNVGSRFNNEQFRFDTLRAIGTAIASRRNRLPMLGFMAGAQREL